MRGPVRMWLATDRAEARTLEEAARRAGRETLDPPSLPEAVLLLEQRMATAALRRHGGVIVRAARELGIHERVLRYKLAKWKDRVQQEAHIPADDGRAGGAFTGPVRGSADGPGAPPAWRQPSSRSLHRRVK